MKIAVAGTGYVGLSIATLLAQHNEVWAVDIVPEKVEMLNNHKSPIQDEYIERYLREVPLKLTATLDAEKAYKDAEFVVIAAPTNYDSTRNYFDTSAVENVMMPMLIAGVKRSDAECRAKELLAMVQMSHRLTHRPSALSGGEQQRVAIARALANNPSVVLADEPTGNLDTATRDEIQRLFFDLRERTGQTFIIVTHDEALADKSDRKIVMSDGRIV